MNLLKELLIKYINDDLENYHVQFSALIFISFILELELFMIFYTIIPYNIRNKPLNNNFGIKWKTYGKINIIYHELLKSNILEILNIFTCELEKKYKIFIETFINKMFEQINNVQDSKATDKRKQEYMNIFYESFFKDAISKDYRHIYKDWMTRFISNLKKNFNFSDETIKQYINKSIITSLKKFSNDHNGFSLYNTNQIGLFDYIFQYKYYYSCITFSILEFYFLSRLHIKYEELYLDLEGEIYSEDLHMSEFYFTTHKYTNTSCTHWTCRFMDTQTRPALDVQRSFSFKNKAEILFSFIFASYDRYNQYIEMNEDKYKKNQLTKFKEFIDNRQEFISTLLFTEKSIIISSMKINPYNTWKHIKDDYKDDPDIILEAIRSNLLNFKSLYYSNKELYKEQKYIKAAFDAKQLHYHYIKHPKYLEFLTFVSENDQEIVKIAVKQNGLALQFASESLKNDQEIVKIAVKQNGLALQFASESLKNDQEIVKIAVKQNGLALQFASESLKNDQEIVKIAVEQNGLALQFASESLKSNLKIVKIAVEQNGLALQFASESLKNELLDQINNKDNLNSRDNYPIIITAIAKNELALEFIIKNFVKQFTINRMENDIVFTAVKKNGLTLKFARKISKNYNIVVNEAIEQNGLALEFASENLRNDSNIVKAAVKQNGLALKFASEKLRTDSKIVNDAVQQNGLALEFATENFRNDSNIVKAAVKQNGLALEFASEKLRTDSKIVNDAVQQNELALKFASENLRNVSMTVIPVVQKNGLALEFASEKIQNFSPIVIDGVQQNGLALKFASEEKRNNLDIVKAAVEQNGLALEFASEEKRNNLDIVKAAVERNGLALKFASEEKIDDFNIVKAAVQRNGLALKFASEEKIDDFDIVKTAVEQNGLALEFAGEENIRFFLVK
jgi:hypothetical protein